MSLQVLPIYIFKHFLEQLFCKNKSTAASVPYTETVTREYYVKKMSLKVPQNPAKKTRVSAVNFAKFLNATAVKN